MSLIKFTSTNDYDFDVEPISIITDSSQLTKRASVKDQLKYEKTPDQTDVHWIAVGSDEGYGSNRNLDTFPEEECIKNHNTFVKAGRAVHWNHKNKKTDPKYGNIKAAGYNKPMKRIELIIGLDNKAPKNQAALEKLASGKQITGSMACFRYSAPVTLWNGVTKAISKIVVGEEVLTHIGTKGVVTAVHTRNYNDVLINITTDTDFISSTKDHLFWTCIGGKLSWVRADELKDTYYLTTPTQIPEKYLLHKINKIDTIKINETVYDITVPGDDSFVCFGVGVHNCKIPSDECSWCHHFAKDDSHRCQHIPSQLGEMNKQGEICKMINRGCNWFEYSLVDRQADRIAYSLNKLASDSKIQPMMTEDYLTLYSDFQIPDDLYISKKASDKREIVRKLAEMEKHIETVTSGKKPSTAKALFLMRQMRLKHDKPIDHDNMDELRKHEPKKTYRALADKGIIMKPEDFMHYLFGDKANEEMTEKMKTHLPHAFSNMEEKGSDYAVNEEKFEPAELDLLPKELRNIVGKMVNDHSLFGDKAINRVIQITIKMGPKSEEMKKVNPVPDKSAEKLAEVYTAYKLAALNHLQDNDKLTEEVMFNSLIQNL